MSHLFFSVLKLRFSGFALRAIELTILCWIAVGSLQSLRAQSPDHDLAPQADRAAWLGIGIGAGVISEGASADTNQPGGVSGALYGSFRTGPHLLSARHSGSAELFGDTVSDYGVLFGRAVEAEDGFASVAAGIAGVNGYHEDDDGPVFCGLFSDCEIDGREEFTTIGLPLELQLIWRPSRYLGLGIYAFANLNKKASFAGASLSLQVGRLR